MREMLFICFPLSVIEKHHRFIHENLIKWKVQKEKLLSRQLRNQIKAYIKINIVDVTKKKYDVIEHLGYESVACSKATSASKGTGGNNKARKVRRQYILKEARVKHVVFRLFCMLK